MGSVAIMVVSFAGYIIAYKTYMLTRNQGL